MQFYRSISTAPASTGNSNVLTYQWTDPTGTPLPPGPVQSTATPGQYELTVTDLNNGCDASMTVDVIQDIEDPVVNPGNGGELTCITEIIPLDGSGSSQGTMFSYEWQNSAMITIANSISTSVSDPDTYTLIVTNTDNGCSSEEVVVVTQDIQPPMAEAGPDGTVDCDDLTYTLNNNGSSSGSQFVYEWLDPQFMSIGTGTTVAVADPGQYTMIVTNNNNGCSSQDMVTVNQDVDLPTAVINKSGDLTIDCVDSDVTLDGSASTPMNVLTYEWTFNAGIVSVADVFDVGQAGMYTLTVTNTVNGCTDTDEVTVNEDVELPVAVVADPDDLTCIVDMVMLNGNGSSAGIEFTYSWSGPGNITNGTTLTPEVDATGTYTLTVTNTITGCSNTATATVSEDKVPPAAVAVVHDELNCTTDEVNIDASGTSSGAIYTYEWTTTDGSIKSGATSLRPTVDAAGSYTMLVTNTVNGCTNTVTVEVNENTTMPTSFEHQTVQADCYNDGDGQIIITAVGGGTPPYAYSIDGVNFSPVNIFSFLDAGEYTITIQDASGCEYTQPVILSQPEELVVDLGDEIVIELGDEVYLDAQTSRPPNEIVTITWIEPQDVGCDSSLNCSDSPHVSTIYYIQVIDQDGCVATDQVRVVVEKKQRVFIPNAFSPNGDGHNDRFMIFTGQDVAMVKSFLVFNRWGEVVHELRDVPPTNDLTLGWDGSFKGQEMNPAVFIYFAEVEFIDGSVEIFKGDVTLKR